MLILVIFFVQMHMNVIYFESSLYVQYLWEM